MLPHSVERHKEAGENSGFARAAGPIDPRGPMLRSNDPGGLGRKCDHHGQDHSRTCDGERGYDCNNVRLIGHAPHEPEKPCCGKLRSCGLGLLLHDVLWDTAGVRHGSTPHTT